MIRRSRIDNKMIELIEGAYYKISEPDHLGFSEILEKIPSLEDYKMYEKIIINSSYGCYVPQDEQFTFVSPTV